MPKHKNKKDNWWFWFAIGLSSYLLTAPNSTIIRVLVGHIEPIEFTFIRSLIVVAISVPFILFSIKKLNRLNLAYSLSAGLCMLIAILSMTYAIKYSSASYTIIIGLLSPILLIVLSRRLTSDRMGFRALGGVALAGMGALIIILAPLLVAGNTSTHFYPIATVLMLINIVFFTLGILFSRKANEAGMPLTANSGFMSIVILLLSFTGMYVTHGIPTDIIHFSIPTWIGIFYSSIVVVFIARIMNIASYEHIGAATIGGLNYLGTIVAIIIPIVLLGEKLPVTIVLGGIVILLGVYLTENHRVKQRNHRYIHGH
jgi:drug/metabolite transporter (DMT)-like permease